MQTLTSEPRLDVAGDAIPGCFHNSMMTDPPRLKPEPTAAEKICNALSQQIGHLIDLQAEVAKLGPALEGWHTAVVGPRIQFFRDFGTPEPADPKVLATAVGGRWTREKIGPSFDWFGSFPGLPESVIILDAAEKGETNKEVVL